MSTTIPIPSTAQPVVAVWRRVGPSRASPLTVPGRLGHDPPLVLQRDGVHPSGQADGDLGRVVGDGRPDPHLQLAGLDHPPAGAVGEGQPGGAAR